MAEREFVMLDAFEKYGDDELVAVQERLEREAESVLAELATENQRRSELAIEAALARAQRAGVTVRVDSSDQGAPKKRGRKPKGPKPDVETANGHDDDADSAPLDAE